MYTQYKSWHISKHYHLSGWFTSNYGNKILHFENLKTFMTIWWPKWNKPSVFKRVCILWYRQNWPPYANSFEFTGSWAAGLMQHWAILRSHTEEWGVLSWTWLHTDADAETLPSSRNALCLLRTSSGFPTTPHPAKLLPAILQVSSAINIQWFLSFTR